MSHEQSETIQGPDGRWSNVYGRRTKKRGQRLPGDTGYDTVDEAVEAARRRSRSFDVDDAFEGAKKKKRP